MPVVTEEEVERCQECQHGNAVGCCSACTWDILPWWVRLRLIIEAWWVSL